MQNIIANIASIATIILFIFYFIGRFIIIKKEKNGIYEQIDLYITNSENIFKKYKIVDEIVLDENSSEYMIITPTEKMYNWIKIYKYNGNELVKEECLWSKDNLSKNHSIKIKAYIVERVPKYIIKFERSDYMTGEIFVVHNGKNVIQEEMIKCKHTLKSILYYVLK
jgi:hypothetical protein